MTAHLREPGEAVGPAGPTGPAGGDGADGADGDDGAGAEATARDAAIAAAIALLINSAPALLDTLDEIAAALGDDPNFATTITTSIATKVAKSLYDAHTLLTANADDTPGPLTVSEQTLVGRITGGNITSLTVAQVKTLLALVKADVGLGNVDNTSDANKPVSTAQQTALDLKANLASPIGSGVATWPVFAPSGLTGATVASRYVGSTNTGGPPTTGTFVAGDWITTIFAGVIPAILVCTVGGSQGTWVNLTLLYATLASPVFTGTVTLPLVTGTGVDTDSTMAANSDTKLASQKAIKTALATKQPLVARGRTKHGGTTDYSIPGVVFATATSSIALAVSTLVYDFFIVDTPITLDQMAFYVTIAPASNANVRIGIYAADTDWQPTGAPVIDCGAVAVASGFTGAKTIAAAVTLPAGRYMTAINCDVAMTVRAFRGFLPIGGWDSTLASGGALSGGSVASTYGALPTPTPTAWTQGLFIGDHRCMMRISVP